MKKLSFILFLALSLGTYAQDLTIDSKNAKVDFNFGNDKAIGTVSGIKAKVHFDTDNLSNSSISGTADVTTINTGNNKRDNHLNAEDYFYSEKYPTMSFKSSSISKTKDGYEMVGDMTIKDKTNEVTITFTYEDNAFIGHSVIYTNDFEVATKKERESSKVDLKFTIPVK